MYVINNNIIKKINDSYNNYLLGNTLAFTDEEKSLIYDEVTLILRRVNDNRGGNISQQEYMLVILALVELTKEWNSNEDSWRDYISKKLLGSKGSINGKIYQQICLCIEELSKYNKFFILDCFTKKYYTSICCHALSPKSSTYSFFDLCWEIYCKDLFQQYSSNDPILEVIAASLNKKFQSGLLENDEDITIGSKVYSIRAGIKGLALIKDKTFLYKLLDDTLGTIHLLMNNEPVSNNTYLKVLLLNWWKEKESSFGIKLEKSKKQKTFIVSDYSQIKPKYVLENGTVRIVVPPIRLHEQFDCEPTIEIMNRDIILINESIPTFGSGIIMTTMELNYSIDDLVDNSIEMSITIKHGENVIFKSKKTLYREFILFYGDRECGSDSLLPGTYFLYSTNVENITIPKDIKRISKNLYSIVTTDGDVIQLSNRIVFFEFEKTEKELYFTTNEKRNIIYKRGDIIYKLIDGDLFLNISTDYNIVDVGIRYDGGVFPLRDFGRELINDKYRFNISVLAEPGEAVTISAFKYSDNSILGIANIIKFNNISVTFDKTLYYGTETTGKIYFKTERYDLEGKFDVLDGESSLPFNDGELIYSPPILKWKIDQGDWNFVPNNGLYYKDISNTSVLELQLPVELECVVALTNGKIIESEKNKNSYKIGQTIYSLDNSIGDGTIGLFVKINNKFYNLICFYLRQSFRADPILVRSDDYMLEWNPTSFIGEKTSKILLQVKDSLNVVTYQREMSVQELEKIDLSVLKENYYTVVLLEKKGFLPPKTELTRKRILLGNIKNVRFKDKVLQIKEAMFFNMTNSDPIRPIYISDLKYLGNKNGSDFYSGRIFVYNRYGEKRYLNIINTTRINPVRVELKTLSSCYLGYGLNEKDPEFEFDNEFVVNSDGMTTLWIKGETKQKFVDYFIFET